MKCITGDLGSPNRRPRKLGVDASVCAGVLDDGDEEIQAFRIDRATGALIVTTAGGGGSTDDPSTTYQTGVDQSTPVASATRVNAVSGINDSAGILYLGIYNSAVALTSGVSVPVAVARVAAGAEGRIGADLLPHVGKRLSTGFVAAWSTRFDNYTAPGAATALSIFTNYNV